MPLSIQQWFDAQYAIYKLKQKRNFLRFKKVEDAKICDSTKLTTRANKQHQCLNIYLLETATLSNSSLFLNAYEFGDSLAAFMSSSAKHSAIVLMFRKADSRAPFMCWKTKIP